MRLFNTSDLMAPDWRFIEPVCDAPTIDWRHVSGVVTNGLERMVRRPNLARWRAAFQTCAGARGAPEDSLIVSHLPALTMATSLVRRRLCPSVPQVAFAFNFTVLPGGLRRRVMTAALSDVAEFVVFSRFERGLYARAFDLDPARLRFLPWAMEAPACAAELPAGMPRRPYLCAIGGEGRDYRSLAAAMRRLPGLRMVVVARPHSVAGIDFPSNVRVFLNLPQAQTWAIARNSLGMAIPLKSGETPCGHVTLVGAQLLGVPLVITRSAGVADYVEDGRTARLVAAGSASGLAAGLSALVEAPAAASAMAARAQAVARTRSDLRGWVRYFEDLRHRRATGALLPAPAPCPAGQRMTAGGARRPPAPGAQPR